MKRIPMFRTVPTACASMLALAGAAYAQPAEIEPNETKAQADVNIWTMPAAPAAGVITGTSTSAVSTAGDPASRDLFRVRVPAGTPGIYRNRLVIPETGMVGNIMGRTQTAVAQATWLPGMAVGTSVASETTNIQTSSTATTPARMVQWYTFGAEADIYYRVNGVASTTAPYSVDYDVAPVTTIAGPTGLNGVGLEIETIGEGHSTDTDLWVLDSNFNAITGYGNDDEAIAAVSGVTGATGATLQSALKRDYANGTYYLAISNFQMCLSNPSPSDDDFRTGTLTDFAGVLVNSSTTTNLNMAVRIGGTLVPATKVGPYDIVFIEFTVAATGSCTLANASCSITSEPDCDTAGGTWDDGGTCPPTGACQNDTTGACTTGVNTTQCTNSGGTFLGDGSACPPTGACQNNTSGVCSTTLNEEECLAQGGHTFLGDGSLCPPTGRCCLVGGACEVRNEENCAFVGGDFAGDNTGCGSDYDPIAAGGSAFEDISVSGTNANVVVDDGAALLPIGFNFSFYGNSFTSVYASSNGYLTFTNASLGVFTNQCPVPNATAPNNAIHPLWDDYDLSDFPTHPGRILYETKTSPNRFIVQWDRVGHYNGSAVPLNENTFQAVLFEDGHMEFRYGPHVSVAACLATVGIENAAGTVGLNYSNTLVADGTTLIINLQAVCPVNGACCVGAACSIETEADCTSVVMGTYQGDGELCTPNPCVVDPIGACCNGAVCTTGVLQSVCTGGGGVFDGGPNGCTITAGPPHNFCCPGNFNRSTEPVAAKNVTDIFAGLSAYFANDPAMDWDGSGLPVTLSDFFLFFGDWFLSCN